MLRDAAVDIPPSTVTTPADLEALDGAARKFETPCGAGLIRWRSWGQGTPVVLLHGGAGSWTHWVRNIAVLVAAGRRVWIPDMPGFGESAAPPDGDDADAVARWLARGFPLVADGAVDVVAFSFGALVGTFVAVEQPALVNRLVLVGAPSLSADPLPRIELRPWQDAQEGEARRAVHRHNLAELMLAHEASIDPLAVHLHAQNVARDRLQRRRLMLGDTLLKLLPRLQCPLWGIWGTQDALYRDRLEIIGNALAHAPDLQQLSLVAQAGHWVQYERSAAFNALLRRILAA
ncbi:MAG TPA: alpha/beta fold hydrolase [Ramlibacter sp.]|nr:alpha/beta fold hydrolase [Ramlibacter sp.]